VPPPAQFRLWTIQAYFVYISAPDNRRDAAAVPKSSILRRPHALAQALQLHHQGRLAEAEPLYAEILKVRPDQFDALQMMGLIKLAKGICG
jgi:hypothetical protein